MNRPFALLLALCLLVPAHALARRAQIEVEGQGTSSGMAAPHDGDADREELSADRIGPRPRARVAPPYQPTTADVRAALARARPEIATCLDSAGYVGSVRVDARIETSRALVVTVTPRPVDGGVRACAELAAQRQLANIAGGPIRRTLRGSITVRRRGAVAPVRPPRHPRPPSGADASLVASVRARLDQDRGGMLQCLSSAAPGVVGRATLRVTLQPDGSLVLSSASLPTGVPAGPSLPCLSARIGTLRFAPAPSRALPIEHAIELGL